VPQARDQSFVGLVLLSVFRGADKLVKAVGDLDLWSGKPGDPIDPHNATHGMIPMRVQN
jgi:hypothetical protein